MNITPRAELVASGPRGRLAVLPPAAPADFILHGGKILTVDAEFSIVQALAVRGDRILATGSDAEVLALARAGATVLDLKGATVIPGLVDSHHHFLNRAARAYYGVRLDFYSNVRDLVNSVAEKARAVGPGKLVLSTAGNAIELLDELRAPTIEELDSAAPDNPVVLTMEDGLRINSRMIERAGLTPETPVPPGGAIGRDPVTGKLNGVISGTAIPLVLDRASDEGGSPRVYTPEQMREAFLWGQREANAMGLTGVRHPHTEIFEMRVLQSLWQTGELTLRVAMDIGFEPHHQTPAELGRRLSAWGVTQPFGDEWLRLHGVGELGIDQSTDGMLLSWTYKNLPPAARGDPAYRGIMRIDQETLNAIILEVHRSGWRPVVHAGGDVAVDMLLTAYEEADKVSPIAGQRWVVDHAHFGQARHIERIKKLQLLVYMQYHGYMYYPIFANYHGKEGVEELFPAREWLDAGITVVAGSDYSKMPPNPWEGIYFFTTRDTKKWGVIGARQAVTREQALRMYTINTAIGSFEEDSKGSLEPGKFADMVILSDDYLAVPDRALRDLHPLATIVGGKVVFRHEACDLVFPDPLVR
jgi:predicted amidohydrolase YtcJ